ncbi:MAG: hypothetical protein WC777_03760 [Candidatus Gracilibacteria bacterium]|jgi:hypothetical protein
MTLTLLALLMLPLEFKMVLDPKGTRRILKDFADSEGLQFFTSILLLVLALLMLTTSSVSFKWEWESLLSWLAVLTAVKGAATLIPSLNKWKVKLLTEERLPIAGFISMLLTLALIYIDTQVL